MPNFKILQKINHSAHIRPCTLFLWLHIEQDWLRPVLGTGRIIWFWFKAIRIVNTEYQNVEKGSYFLVFKFKVGSIATKT
jgi:hypothetical protein